MQGSADSYWQNLGGSITGEIVDGIWALIYLFFLFIMIIAELYEEYKCNSIYIYIYN